MAAVTLTVLR